MSYRVILLAAGIGERLRPITYDTNKALLEVQGKTLIEHFLDSLVYSKADIDTVHIVIGHYGYKIRSLIPKDYKGLRIQFLTNRLYKVTGDAHSLYIANHILEKHPCLIAMADYLFDPNLMKNLFESEYKNCTLVEDKQVAGKSEIFACGNSGTLSQIIYAQPPLPNPVGTILEFFKLDEKASNALSVILENYLMTDGVAIKTFVEEPLNRLMKGFDMHYILTEGRKWIEIDFPKDWEKAIVMGGEIYG